MRYCIWTIGCQMNKSESERLAAYLENQGYLAAEKIEDADLVILNGCVVRQSAEDRVINKLYNLRDLKKARPGLKIAVTGCIVEEDGSAFLKKFPFIDHLFKAGDFPEWLGDYDLEQTLPRNPAVATYLPIMQGCNNFCAYCIVPYRRGREKSRRMADIMTEVHHLVYRGVKEITLLGQNVNSYGQDLPEKIDLADLLVEINSVTGLKRLRFLTNHPKDIPEKLVQTIVKLDKVCHQINIPCQAGDDEILQAMRRGYTVEHYRQVIALIRRYIPGVSLSTDVIVGFPGEKETHFMNTYKLLQEIRFDMVHVAAYSTRPGTLAARTLVDDVPLPVKKERLQAVEELQAGIAGEINAQMKGQSVEVLVEGREKGRWYGRTGGDKLVFIGDERDWQSQLVKVKVQRTSPWSMSGSIDL